jgi:hypothetical protein|tara:strand:+ start:70 stop:423 length:354 start_codon:yes stop_codon:yes gene_type:complete
MTDLSRDNSVEHPHRLGFSNFRWTTAAVTDWEAVWNALWLCNIKWEWQDGDQYARRRGEEYQLFRCHGDAVKLDMALPLPQVHVIQGITNWLLGAHLNDNQASEAGHLIREWIKNYV